MLIDLNVRPLEGQAQPHGDDACAILGRCRTAEVGIADRGDGSSKNGPVEQVERINAVGQNDWVLLIVEQRGALDNRDALIQELRIPEVVLVESSSAERIKGSGCKRGGIDPARVRIVRIERGTVDTGTDRRAGQVGLSCLGKYDTVAKRIARCNQTEQSAGPIRLSR